MEITKHILTSFRRAWWAQYILMIVCCVLFIRTIAFNHDFSLTFQDDAPNYCKLYDKLHKQPIRSKIPRPLSSITLPMAKILSDCRKVLHSLQSIVEVSSLFVANTGVLANTSLSLPSYNSISTPKISLFIVHCIFRI